ncbi:E3 ubiquitin-protein ligase RLIM-like isoform X1 [Arapaima gigas]
MPFILPASRHRGHRDEGGQTCIKNTKILTNTGAPCLAGAAMENAQGSEEGAGSGDLSDAQRRRHRGRLAREDAFYHFVNSLSEEDYRLMRDNNLFGTPGNTQNEIFAKDAPLQPDNHENSGSDDQDDGSDGDSSLLDWLNSMRRAANRTRSRYQGNQSWRAATRTNPTNSGIIRFSLEINVNRNTQQQADGEQLQGREGGLRAPSDEPEMLTEESSDSSVSSVTEPATSTEETLFERLLRGGRRRARSRSPEQSWTRPRRDESPSPLSLNQTDGLPQVRHAVPRLDPQQEAADHGHFRSQERLRFRHSSVEPEVLLGVVPEPVPAPQATDDPGTRVEEDDTATQRAPTIMLDLQVRRVQAGEHRQQEGIASRTRSRSQAPDTSPHDSNHGDFQRTFSRSDQAGVRTYVSTIRIPVRRVADAGQSDPTSVETTVRQMLMGFGELSYLMDSGLDSVDPDSRPSAGPSSGPSEVTPTSGSDAAAAAAPAASGADPRPDEPPSRDRDASPVAPAPSAPPISSLPFLRLAHFFLLSGDIEEQPRGLTKEQIDNLSMRNYGDSDALKTCSVCIMEYSQGNKLRKLPCSHEYHVHCIDRWLSENSTCPVCRRAVLGSSNRENVL